MTRAAIGFRAHSGWAAAVAVSVPPDPPAIVIRRRIEMGEPQPYHAAVNLEIAEARLLISRSAEHAAARAADSLRRILDDLRALGHQPAACGLLLASGRPLPALEKILASHALVHTAEGVHFRAALRAAGQACGLPVFEFVERDLALRPDLLALMAAMGKGIGPPWRQDQKFAAAAAWLALG